MTWGGKRTRKEVGRKHGIVQVTAEKDGVKMKTLEK